MAGDTRTPAWPSSPAVELRGLRKSFGRRRALDGIELDLEAHQIVGVVGPDGAGKTTLIRTLAGLLEIEAEKASVLGYDLRQDVTALKAEVGYVPQSFSLQRDLSVIENLRFTARLLRLPREEFETRARMLLERTAMAPFQDRTAGALSGGMKQKLAVANALLIRPKLLLLDEPTAGVDVPARAEIWGMLGEARSEALVVISTSYMEEADACDRLLYLDSGRLLASGSPEQLRSTVPIELYRAWSDDPRAVARHARRLPYVEAARQTGVFTRVEVAAARSPGLEGLRKDLMADEALAVRLLERLPVDMESTLLHLARSAAA